MIERLLVANRGEIALRVMRTAAEMGIRTVAVAPDDDRRSIHVRQADSAQTLSGHGPSAYLDAGQIIRDQRGQLRSRQVREQGRRAEAPGQIRGMHGVLLR